MPARIAASKLRVSFLRPDHPMPVPFRPFAPLILLAALALPGAAHSEGPGRFCGGPATPGDPSDLANVVGDQTLEYTVELPASLLTCARGYLLEKCGDHESAHKIFDKCIAAGYVGAMIWKALLLEDGTGVPRDDARATELMHRAATSDDPHYAPIGKLHYATALYLGRGVPKNEQEARKWFAAAAAEGNEEAAEFLRTGYHTGSRDQTGMGVGTPTAAALAGPPRGDNASLPRHSASPTEPIPAPPPLASRPPPSRPSPALPEEVTGQRLTLREALPLRMPGPASLAACLVLLAAFVGGMLRQRLVPRFPSPKSAPRP